MSLIVARSVRGQQLPVRVRRPGERRSLSRSATRALDLMELFGEMRRPLRAVEVAQLLAMHPSTTNQLLKTMVDSGHLVFDAKAKTYLPSPRLSAFSSWVADIHGLGGQARSLLRSVQARTGLVATLTTPNDLYMQIVDLATPPGHSAERGLRISLFGSAVGSAYLSALGEGEILRLADRARIPADQLPAIMSAATQIRAAGFADGPTADGAMWSIAMPLPRDLVHVPAVLGISGPVGEVAPRLAELHAIMRSAVQPAE